MKKLGYILPALFCLVYLLWLSFHTRLSHDDYMVVACFKTNSFSDAIKFLYTSYPFRWTSFSAIYFTLVIPAPEYYPISISVFFTLLYAFWIFSFHRLIQNIFKSYFNYAIDAYISLSLAVIAITLFYFSASQAVESFTYLIVCADRLVPIAVATYAAGILINSKFNLKTQLILALCALIIAGAAENVTISVLLVLSGIVARSFLLKGDRGQRIKILFFLAGLLLFFLFEYFLPGRISRTQVEKTFHFTCGTDGVYCATTFSSFLKKFFSARQIFVGPLLLFFFCFGMQIPSDVKELLRVQINKIVLFVLLLLLCVFAFHYVIAFQVFDSFGPMRMWLPVNILLAAFSILISFSIGMRIKKEINLVHIGAALLLCFSLGEYFVKHYSETRAYTIAYDQRINTLLSIKATESPVSIYPLPPSDLVVNGEIMENEQDDVNRDFKNTYGLRFEVRRIK